MALGNLGVHLCMYVRVYAHSFKRLCVGLSRRIHAREKESYYSPFPFLFILLIDTFLGT